MNYVDYSALTVQQIKYRLEQFKAELIEVLDAQASTKKSEADYQNSVKAHLHFKSKEAEIYAAASEFTALAEKAHVKLLERFKENYKDLFNSEDHPEYDGLILNLHNPQTLTCRVNLPALPCQFTRTRQEKSHFDFYGVPMGDEYDFRVKMIQHEIKHMEELLDL